MKTLGLLGTFIRDRILPLKGPPVECVGGLYHSLAYAAFLAGDRMRIVPVARVGSDFWPQIEKTIAQLPCVDSAQLLIAERENTAVTLCYLRPTEREEITTEPMPPLQPEEVSGLECAGAILINMITGEDVALDTVRWLAEKTRALLYFDFHTLALGIDAKGRRYYRQPLNWQAWFDHVHIAQMNEGEAHCLSGARGIPQLSAFMRELLQRPALQGVLITLGEQGVLAGWQHQDGTVQIRHLAPAIARSEVIDVIGCGDAFGAAFVTAFLDHGDFWRAATFANLIAGRNATFLGSVTREHFEEKVRSYATGEK